MTIMTQGHADRGARRRRSWWFPPLAVAAVAFVAWAAAPYLTLDPGRSRIPPPEGVRWYYPALAAHVVFGSVAMLTCCAQVWPWLRRRYPALHRRIGRVYVLGGVVPAAALALAIASVGPLGLTLAASDVLLSVVWLFVTVAGYRAGRRGGLVAHRRWMARSFALTFSIVTNRVWAAILFVILIPRVDTTFGGSEAALVGTVAGLTGWLGWVIPLLAVELWLERGASAPRRAEAASPA